MKIILDLAQVVNKETLFETLSKQLIIVDWGNNWDALNDCLRDLDSGGYTKKYDFPLEIELINWRQFESKSPTDFKLFKEILNNQISEHSNFDKSLTVSFG